MTNPQSHIAFTPWGVGLMCALVYLERDADVFGWWLGARDAEFHSAYFKLEKFFATKPTRFYATDADDLYGGWKFLYSARSPALDKALAVDDEAAHELDRVQGMFVAEWLFFADGAGIEAELAAYDKIGMALHPVNIRSKRLGKFDESQPTWVYQSHDFNTDVLGYLQRYWPLDYRGSQSSVRGARKGSGAGGR